MYQLGKRLMHIWPYSCARIKSSRITRYDYNNLAVLASKFTKRVLCFRKFWICISMLLQCISPEAHASGGGQFLSITNPLFIVRVSGDPSIVINESPEIHAIKTIFGRNNVGKFKDKIDRTRPSGVSAFSYFKFCLKERMEPSVCRDCPIGMLSRGFFQSNLLAINSICFWVEIGANKTRSPIDRFIQIPLELDAKVSERKGCVGDERIGEIGCCLLYTSPSPRDS